ncbi:MAG: glutathione S-transferase family protein [Gammaproteobacteria bacterium]|nr:glutathione S-transferase family protein [Gammaproteobacteria bacterium]
MVVLYGINLSTFTRKVRLALLEKGVGHRFEMAPMGSPKVRALHPLGKIPVIEHAGAVIPDSSVIIAYLERAWPAHPLYPADAVSLARALWLEEYADTRLREATLPFFAENVVKPVFQGKPGDAAALVAAAPARDESFTYLERELPDCGLAVGESLSVADVAIGTQLITYRQGAGDPEKGRWPKLARYLDSLVTRPHWSAVLAEEDAALLAARARRSAAAAKHTP